MRPAIFAVGLACLALTACAGARKPDTHLPTAFEADAAAAQGGMDAAGLDTWWTQFHDPALTALIEQALVNAPDARTAAAKLREARVTAAGAFTAFLPQGNATASTHTTHTTQTSGTMFNIPGFSTNGKSQNDSAALNVTWEVDLFGRIFAVAKAAHGDTAQARMAYEGARASLAANVADTYFQTRGLAIQLRDAEDSVRIQQSLQDVTAKRAQYGLAPESDADRVAGDLAQAQGQASALGAELKASRRTLLVLVGRGADPLASFDVTAEVGEAPPVPATIPGALLARRPDVRQAQAAIASAAGRLAYQQLAFFPTFNLTPGVGLSNIEQPGFSSGTHNWSIGASVTQPVFGIPQLIVDLKTQDARTEQAVIAYEKVVQTAYGEADSVLVRLAADRQQVALLTAGEARAHKSYDASRFRYNAGIDDLQTTLSAEQSWRATRTQKTNAQVQAVRRAVQTYKALGGGWPLESAPTNKEAR
jgi:multidrug efflux system outer membrane protein